MARVLSPSEQNAHMAAAWPVLRATRRQPGHYTWQGRLQPTLLSDSYLVEIELGSGAPPDVRVLDPPLVRRDSAEQIPHMYEQERLCLYIPFGTEFDAGRSLATQVVPWICVWLFHYEAWHATGAWAGGGLHPEARAPRRGR